MACPVKINIFAILNTYEYINIKSTYSKHNIFKACFSSKNNKVVNKNLYGDKSMIYGVPSHLPYEKTGFMEKLRP